MTPLTTPAQPVPTEITEKIVACPAQLAADSSLTASSAALQPMQEQPSHAQAAQLDSSCLSTAALPAANSFLPAPLATLSITPVTPAPMETIENHQELPALLAPISSPIADSAQPRLMPALPSPAPSASLEPLQLETPVSPAHSSSLTVQPATTSTALAIPALMDFTGSTVERPARLAALLLLAVPPAPLLTMLAQPSPAPNAQSTPISRTILALLAPCSFRIALPATLSTTLVTLAQLATTERQAELSASLVED